METKEIGMSPANPATDQNGKNITDDKWRSLYLLGGVAALVAAIVFRRWLSAEFGLMCTMSIFTGCPKVQPTTVIDWFALLESNASAGLVLLNALDLINYALVGLIFLGLYAALRKSASGPMTLAVIFAFTGIAIYFTSNQAFSMLFLSRQYSAAATDSQKIMFLAAGQALLTLSNPLAFGSGVFWSFNFVTVSGLVISGVMLQSRVFSWATAYIGIVANVLGLGYFFTVAFNPALTFIPLSASAPFLLVWYVLIGLRLLKLARLNPPPPTG